MALDGVVIAGVVSELKRNIIGGRIYKIYQPENDEICMVIKNRIDEVNVTKRLVMSANASLPLIYFSGESRENPATAPNFCMLLRKHIGNGRIVSVEQPELERIVIIGIEHLDDMGDLCRKKLIIEIMGKHSNIIFTDDKDMIIDSIKHISYQISSVREVLPGRSYTMPPSQEKVSPFDVDVNYFMNHIMLRPQSVSKAIYTAVTGISPLVANEIAYRAGVDGGAATDSVTADKRELLYKEFHDVVKQIKEEAFTPCIAYDGYEPKEYSVIKLRSYGEYGDSEKLPDGKYVGLKAVSSVSSLLEEYYSGKSVTTRIKQRSTDLRKTVANAIERTTKKLDLQRAQLKDTEDREKYKVYGELITAYGYSVLKGAKELTCENYYTGEMITIPLDPEKAPMETGKKYFARYNKQKRTYEALTEQLVTTTKELEYLMSVKNSLEIATSLSDLSQIKEELVESGYIRGRSDKGKNKKSEKSKPLHYISSDGFHMYVGKNNYQNEELSFKVAAGSDMWFHAKNMPGSHVIVKAEGDKELPDGTYEEAARLAAYYSSGRDAKKVEVDYTEKKNLKKPPKSKPGFVIYHTNYSMSVEPDIHGIKEEK